MIDLDDCVEVAKRFGATAVNSAASEALKTANGASSCD